MADGVQSGAGDTAFLRIEHLVKDFEVAVMEGPATSSRVIKTQEELLAIESAQMTQ